jgi:hypothetical protein
MKALIKEATFFIIASAIILPAPTLVFAYMTGKTVWQILYR